MRARVEKWLIRATFSRNQLPRTAPAATKNVLGRAGTRSRETSVSRFSQIANTHASPMSAYQAAVVRVRGARPSTLRKPR